MRTPGSGKDWADLERPWRIPVEERDDIVAAWTATGQREHGSVAFFSRAILDLLALGAPSRVVERTASAIADEIRHARSAFGLATSYAGSPIGPADLAPPIEHPLDPGSVLDRWLDRVCIEHATRALASSVAAQHVRDPAVRTFVAGMAEDDSVHADLGWRVVAWLLETFEPARALARSRLVVLAEAEPPASVVRSEPSLRHGVVSAAMFDRMRAHVVGSIVVPTLRAHVARSQAPDHAA